MNSTNEKRQVLLVGSVPLANAAAVFEAVGETLGELAPRIPDGETGQRTAWIFCLKPVLASTANLRKHREFELAPGFTQIVYEIADRTKPLAFGPLGYAAAAKASYDDFARLKKAGRVPKGTKFQVSLPTPLAVLTAFFEPKSQELAEKPLAAAMINEVNEIARVVPRGELAIQWDVCHEILILDGWTGETFFDATKQGMIGRVAAMGNATPADIELGFHLCYGDPGHKHLKEPDDLATSVDICNMLFEQVKRPIAWVHMPVPRGRDDDAYFAPLKNLHLPAGTQLFLGLVHLTGGLEGTRRRMETAKRVRSDFGIACECGFGRRPPETVHSLLDLHRQAAAI